MTVRKNGDRSEVALVQQAKAGDVDALNTLLKEQYQRIFSICFLMMRNRQAAEDQAQETLIRISRKLSTFKENAAFSTWCYTVAKRICLDELRKQQRQPLVASLTCQEGLQVHSIDLLDITAAIEWKDIRSDLQNALDTLPIEFAQAVIMRDILQLDYSEIAEISGVVVGTVKSRISRSRKMLAQLLEEYAFML